MDSKCVTDGAEGVDHVYACQISAESDIPEAGAGTQSASLHCHSDCLSCCAVDDQDSQEYIDYLPIDGECLEEWRGGMRS